ncbi:hypothetical protein BG015_000908, partial [Linnemannia schmuckeri]
VPDDAFESKAERIAFKMKIRILAVLTICGGVESLGSGMPRMLEHTAAYYPIPLESPDPLYDDASIQNTKDMNSTAANITSTATPTDAAAAVVSKQ